MQPGGGGLRAGVEQVGADGPLEEHGLLGHQRHGPAEVGEPEVADVHPVEEHGAGGLALAVLVDPLGQVIEAGGQRQQRGLAGPAGAEDAHPHPRLDLQADAVEHLGPGPRPRGGDACPVRLAVAIGPPAGGVRAVCVAVYA